MLRLVWPLETLLILLVCQVVGFQALQDQIQRLVKPSRIEAPKDHRLIGNRVWNNTLVSHFCHELLSLDDVVSLDAGLNQAGVDNQTWLDRFAFHLFKDSKSVLQLVDLREDLD